MVILMRHGKAVSKEAAGSDEERWLTEEGKRDVERVAKCLPRPSAIFSSPLRRARETAEILANRFGIKYEVLEELSPGKFDLDVLRRIARPGAVYVGHNPDMERTLEQLCCRAKLSAGGAAVVSLAEGRLYALLNPDYCP